MTVSEFLTQAYTCYHAAEIGAKLLAQAGFVNLDTEREKAAKAIGAYRVEGGSLYAVRFGKESGLQLAFAHTDSPSLRIRYTRGMPMAMPAILDTEKYGGGLLRSFLDRKLKIAGRLIVGEGETLRAVPVVSDFHVVIPSLAVHLGGADETLTCAHDLRPVLGCGDDLYAALGHRDATDGDLFCVPAEAPYTAGVNGEWLCAPRIDNLVSVYACLRGMIDCTPVCDGCVACFNGEETGSEIRTGACGRLLPRFLADAYAARGKKEDTDELLAHAFAFSCDGAHALHPLHREKYSEGAPVLGGGVVIKRNDRYATDALTASAAQKIFSRAQLPYQTYFHHPDMRCGSTVGLTAAHNFGCHTCDIGVGQWAMHSAVETASVRDIDDLVALLTAHFSLHAEIAGDTVTIR